jgi:predicted DCC family thiol-disulfide oxidoreductase YuxK
MPLSIDGAERAQFRPIQLYFDGECGLCVRAINGLRALDGENRLEFLDTAEPQNVERLRESSGKSPDIERSMWALSPDGGLHEGYDAFRVAFKSIRKLRWIEGAMKCPPLSLVGPAIYRYVASHRRSLGCKIETT